MTDRPWYRRPKRPRSHPQPVGKLLDDLLRRRNLTEPLRIFEIQRRWPSLVGATTAARTWPTSLRQGVLVIHVADSTWVQELTYLKAELLAKVQSAVSPDAVTEVRFYVREGASSLQPDPPNRSDATPTEDPAARPLAPDVSAALDAFENDLDQIEDPDLRRSIRRAFVEHLLR